jgi:hypothetical protein
MGGERHGTRKSDSWRGGDSDWVRRRSRAGWHVVDLTQEGGNVVATGSGAIDLTGLSFHFTIGFPALIDPSSGEIFTGPTIADLQAADVYSGITGPGSFGSGAARPASSGSGDLVGVGGALFVPTGYVSGSPLSDTSTYDGQTFATIGATPGKFEWKWGTGPTRTSRLSSEPWSRNPPPGP